MLRTLILAERRVTIARKAADTLSSRFEVSPPVVGVIGTGAARLICTA